MQLPRRRRRRPLQVTGGSKTPDLRKLYIGDPQGENELLGLDEYFVETSAYFNALGKPIAIVVGRRGTGKSANLHAIQTAISNDKPSHVCVIKPIGYELEGLIRVLDENLHRSERGYLIQSLWKYLIFSELARSVFEEVSEIPAYIPLTPDQEKFMEIMNSNRDTLLIPFAQRLEKAVRTLVGVGNLSDAVQQQTRISELLHQRELHELRQFLGLVLSDRNRVAILIGRLDDPWGPGADLGRLSELLMGLLKVIEDIGDEFLHHDRWRKKVNVSVTVFLRSDSYALFEPFAAEQDKLPTQRITWNEPEVLLNVLDLRFEEAFDNRIDARDVWTGLFTSEVVGLPISEFILGTIMHRPRDIIYLVGQAIASATNRGHAVVTADDLVDARNNYSQWVLTLIQAEDDPRKGKLEAVLFEFAGAPKVMKLAEVMTRTLNSMLTSYAM